MRLAWSTKLRLNDAFRCACYALAILGLAIIAPVAEADQCGEFHFPRHGNGLPNWVAPALAKVFRDENGTAYEGTATVVNAKEGLLLTAAHVSRSQVFVRFPERRHGGLYKAEEVSRLDPVDGDQEENKPAWDKARDIAILKLKDRDLRLLAELEVGLDERISRNEEYHFFGFSDDSPSPASGKANAYERGDCTFDLRETAEPGDSGAPVIKENGLVVGILIHAKKYHRGGRFVPTYCFTDLLIKALGETTSRTSLSQLADASVPDAIAMLQPPPRTGWWMSNLRFAAAIEEAIRTPEKLRRQADKQDCPLMLAIRDRELGSVRLKRYIVAMNNPDQANKIGKAFSTEATNLAAKGKIDREMLALTAAQRSYEASISIGSGSESKFTQTAYKGLKDALTRKAKLTANEDPAQAAFLRMRTLHWADLKWSTTVMTVNDLVELTGKVHVFSPETVSLGSFSFPFPAGHIFTPIQLYLGDRLVHFPVSIKPGKTYDFKIVLKARRVGEWRVQPTINVEGGRLIGPGTWVTIVQDYKDETTPIEG